MYTKGPGAVAGAKRRRHTPEFKAKVVEECRRPGVSIASVALANALNANLLRRWMVEASERGASSVPVVAARAEEFVALPLVPDPSAPAVDVCIELRRGETAITIRWPVQAAGECAAWLRAWLR